MTTFIDSVIKGFLIGGFLGLAVQSANAEIFTWTDPNGTIHFVDNKDKIPSKYPLTRFVFNNDHKWTVDQSEVWRENKARLEQLRVDDNEKPAVTPAPSVVIEQHFYGRIKRHRSDRHVN